MSRVQSLLDILIRVSDRGLDKLTKSEVALKTLLTAQAKLEQSQGKLGQSAKTLAVMHDKLTGSITQEGRREVESLKAQKQINDVRKARVAQMRQEIVAAADLAAKRGQFARAEALMQRAIRGSQITETERMRLQIRSLGIHAQQERQMAAMRRSRQQNADAIRREMMAEADLEAKRKNFPRAQQILGRVSRSSSMTGTETILLQQKMLDLSRQEQREMDRQARTQAQIRKHRMANANALRDELMATVNLAAKQKDWATAQQAIQRLLRSGSMTATERLRVQQRQVQLAGEMARADALETARLAALRAERLRHADAIRREMMAQAQLAANRGNFAQAEAIMNRVLRSGVGGADRVAAEQRLLNIQRQRQQGSRQLTATLVQQAMAEAKLARSQGDHAREIRGLQAALGIGGLSLIQRTRLLIAVAAAERHARQEAERHAKAMANMLTPLGRIGGALMQVNNAFRFVTSTIGRFMVLIFGLRMAFHGLQRVLIDPMKAIFDRAVGVTDEFRRLETSISGITGSIRSARDVTKDIGAASQGLPITPLEAIQGVRGLAFTPAVAQILQNKEGRQEGIKDILQILTSLATIDPEQGIQGAQFAVREALSGEFRSLRFRFEISPQIIAQSIGKSLEDLKVDPSLVLPALKAFTEAFVGPRTLEAFSGLMSVQGNLFRGVMEQFFHIVGESGIYDRVVNFLRNTNMGLQRALTGNNGGPTPGTMMAADSISASLERIFDLLINSLEGVIEAATGVKIEFDDLQDGKVDEFLNSISRMIDGLANFTADFITVLAQIGRGLGNVLGVTPLTQDQMQTRIAGLDANIPFIRDLENGKKVPNGFLEHLLGGKMGPMWDLATGAAGFMSGKGWTTAQSSQSMQEERDFLQRLVNVRSGIVNRGLSPEEMANKGLLDSADEALQKLSGTFKGFSQTVAKLPQPSDSELITNQFNSFFTSLQMVAMKLPEQMKAADQVIEDMKGRIAFLKDRGRFAEADMLQTDLDSRMSRRKLMQANFTSDISGGFHGLIEGIGPGLQSMPKKFRTAELMSFVNSMVSLIDSTEDLGKLTAGTAAQAQAQFKLLQSALPAEMRGGAIGGSMLGILGQVPSGESISGILSVSEIGALSQGLRQMFNDLEDTPEKLRPVADGVDGMINRLIERYAGRQDVLRGQIQQAELFQLTGGVMGGAGLPSEFSLIGAQTELGNLTASMEYLRELQEDIPTDARRMAEELKEIWATTSDSIEQSINSGLVDGMVDAFRTGADNIGEIMANMVDAISRAILSAVIEMTVIQGIVRPILGGIGGGLVPSRWGNVFRHGYVQPHAMGGVVSRPSTFSMGGGRFGSVAEDAPEAIMPLQRSRDGRLGVAAGGGGGMNVTQHFNFPGANPDSFRRSERQVAATARRTLGRYDS